jgi:hypothetical protein
MTASCNLGAPGIRLRLRQGLLHGAVLLVLGVALLALDAPRNVRWFAAVPAFLSAMGFLQAATKT